MEVVVDNISKRYGKVEALRGVSFAGKTSLSEQILYHTKSIRSRGRVDHKNTFLDT